MKHLSCILKINVQLILLFNFNPVLGQNLKQQQIDSAFLIHLPQLHQKGDFEKALSLTTKLITQSKEADYQKGIVNGNIIIGNILRNMGKNKESLKYLSIAANANRDLQDKKLSAAIYGEYAKNYTDIGLYQQAIENYDHAIAIYKQMDNGIEKNKLLQYFYACKASTYEEMHQTTPFYVSLKDAYNILPTPITASRFAKYYTVYKKNLDSAAYFLRQADSLSRTGKFSAYEQTFVLRNYGRLYVAKKEYSRAIAYYKESIAISQKSKAKPDERDTYKLLYEAYKAVNDEKNTSVYLSKYALLNDSLNTAQKQALDNPVEKILLEKETPNIHTKNKLYLTILLLMVLGSIIWVTTYKILHTKKREKERLLEKKEEENHALLQKVNESFEDVISLAKENHPNLYTRFQEVYPELHQKLLTINPDLQISELTLSAYIYLGFQTKEIAEYTFKSAKTIQNRKNSLRKRLDIPSADDLYVWFKNRNTTV